MRAVRHLKTAFVYLGLVLLAVVMAGPFIAMILVAFQANPVVTGVDIFNLDFTLDNFTRALNESRLSRWFWNSLVTTGVITIAGTFFSSLSGYVVAKRDFPGKEVIFWLFLAVLMFPVHAWIIPMFVQMSRMGLVNTYWPFFLSGSSSAFGIFLLRQYIEQNVVTDVLDAARIDGCGEFRTYGLIVLPSIIPGPVVGPVHVRLDYDHHQRYVHPPRGHCHDAGRGPGESALHDGHNNAGHAPNHHRLHLLPEVPHARCSYAAGLGCCRDPSLEVIAEETRSTMNRHLKP